MTFPEIRELASRLAHAELLETSDEQERRARNESRQRLAWKAVVDYREMLQFLIDDWRAQSATYVGLMRARWEAVQANPIETGTPLTSAQIEELWADRSIGLRCRLAEESLYVFGNILLDRAAIALKYTLLSRGRDNPPNKHSDLATDERSLDALAAGAGLLPPSARLTELTRGLESEFSDFRDHYVAHPVTGDVRITMGQVFNLDTDEVSLFPMLIDPTEAESAGEPSKAQPTARLIEELDEYLEALLAWATEAHAAALVR